MTRPPGSWKRVAIWAIIILIATSVPVVEITRSVPVPWMDKLVHGAMYAVLGWLVGSALWVSGRRGPLAIGVALVAIAAFAAGDELHQHWLPGRAPMIGDWIADVIGATVGLSAGMATLRRVAPQSVEQR